ncbi:MFS transporter [Roseomonas sp. CECT 9278]|uniref:MFS transporter n=1 Tax=Roseomonas sp. CECT 9278 TaxID=2845823 RepID=UPI001E45F4EB|nr:MFS transporter [Roseomonas sp. CECT 9278]CAH0301093.1 Fosmidomycin resistance protein [Roseomonas sp. CECT 9278]
MSTAAPAPTGQDNRIIALIGTGHFLSHFYVLTLPPLFLLWRDEFGVTFAELGLAVALMSGTTALLQTPVGFMVDRHGARPFLVGGTLLMALSVSAMAFAPGIWAIWLLAILSGVGNSVIHPADYAILAGSIDKNRMGRAFALHTFTGNLGFALAPPVVALLAAAMGWRGALLLVGLLGVPVVVAILVQSRILRDQAKPARTGDEPSGREILLSRPILLFFGFFMLSSMAGSGIQAFVITVLGKLWGTPVAVASMVLTGYMVGATAGTLVGGWVVDRGKQNLIGFVVVLTGVAIAMILALGLLPVPELLLPVVGLVGGLALGASRTPRDVMLKDAAPPGQIGKVFGFVSSGLPLGGAITPVPLGYIIDMGYPQLVLPVVAGLLAASLLCAGSAQAQARSRRMTAAPAE